MSKTPQQKLCAYCLKPLSYFQEFNCLTQDCEEVCCKDCYDQNAHRCKKCKGV